MKNHKEIMQMAKDRVAEINSGKDPGWTPITRPESIIYISAYINGYEKAMEDVKAAVNKARKDEAKS